MWGRALSMLVDTDTDSRLSCRLWLSFTNARKSCVSEWEHIWVWVHEVNSVKDLSSKDFYCGNKEWHGTRSLPLIFAWRWICSMPPVSCVLPLGYLSTFANDLSEFSVMTDKQEQNTSHVTTLEGLGFLDFLLFLFLSVSLLAQFLLWQVSCYQINPRYCINSLAIIACQHDFIEQCLPAVVWALRVHPSETQLIFLWQQSLFRT